MSSIVDLVGQNWPKDASAASNISRFLNDGLHQATKLIIELSAKVNALEKRLNDAGTHTGASHPFVNSPTESVVSNVISSITKSGTIENAALLKSVTTDQRLKETKSKNVVVVGLKESTKSSTKDANDEDTAEFKKIMAHIGAPVTVKRVSRFKRNSNSQQRSTAGNPPILIAELANATEADTALRLAKKLGSPSSVFKGVFLRPDRTPAEQAEFSQLMNMRNTLNAQLEARNMLDSKFRFVIRDMALRCIAESASGARRPYIDQRSTARLRAELSKPTTSCVSTSSPPSVSESAAQADHPALQQSLTRLTESTLPPVQHQHDSQLIGNQHQPVQSNYTSVQLSSSLLNEVLVKNHRQYLLSSQQKPQQQHLHQSQQHSQSSTQHHFTHQQQQEVAQQTNLETSFRNRALDHEESTEDALNSSILNMEV